MFQRFLGEHSISKRSFFGISTLLLSITGWYAMSIPFINRFLSNLSIGHSEIIAIEATFHISIVGTSIIGTFFLNKIGRDKFLYLWTVLGVSISFLPYLITNLSLLQVWIICLLLGASFGFILPPSLAFFTEMTIIENRGRIGGIALVISFLSMPFFVTIANILDLTTNSIIFTLLRGMGFIVLFLRPGKHHSSLIKNNVSFISIFTERKFLLYFVAWSMFPLINNFEYVLVTNFLLAWKPYLFDIMGIVELIIAGFSILIAGFLCDWIGRKKIVLTGFVSLGVGYGLIGFLPYFEPAWYFYIIADGLAWGIFFLTFFLIIWGDIAQSCKSEKYFALGSISYFLSPILQLQLTQRIIQDIDVTAAFSVAAFFLFIAVMPLVFAPETLPEKKMELRRLRSFAEQAKKAREKYERKIES